MQTSSKWIIGGLVGAAVLGGGYWLMRNHFGPLGRVVDRVRKRGMTTTLHYDPIMPIDMRVKLIQKRVYEGVVDPEMRELALAITGNRDKDVQVGKHTFKVRGARCAARDVKCEIKAIYDWVKDNVRYTGDVAPILLPNGSVEAIDFYQAPKRTVEFGGEDCDGHSALVAALLALNGVTPRLRITAPKGSMEWGHIYVVAGEASKENPTKFVAVDTTLPTGTVGTEAPYSRHRDFPADLPA